MKAAIFGKLEKKTLMANLRHKFPNTWITNAGVTFDSGNKAIEEGVSDLCSFA